MVTSASRHLLVPAAALALLAAGSPSEAEIIATTNAGDVAAFQTGADVESFDTLVGQSVSSYDPGQECAPASQFSSRDGTSFPTFHSGGASPGDPVGNPGTPIGIVAPSGAIAGDVVSGANVAAPLVIFTDVLWSSPDGGAFMEVIFPEGEEVERVGFWVTHGTIQLFLRDRNGSNLTTGDTEVSGDAGFFIGIRRDTADIAVAALVGGGNPFTFDDFTSAAPVPEASGPLALAAGALVLALAGRRGGSRRRL